MRPGHPVLSQFPIHPHLPAWKLKKTDLNRAWRIHLYLAAKPFDQLGFRADLGTTPYPEYTKTFLYSVPIVLTLWPAFLLAMNNATKREDESEEGEV